MGSGEPSAVSDRRPEEPSAVAAAPSEMAWPSIAIAVVAIAVARPVAAAVVAAVVAALAVAAFAAAATTSWPAGQSTYVFFLHSHSKCVQYNCQCQSVSKL